MFELFSDIRGRYLFGNDGINQISSLALIEEAYVPDVGKWLGWLGMMMFYIRLFKM